MKIFQGLDSPGSFRRGRYFLSYTLLYALLALGVWGWFLVSGKSLICTTDAYKQHIVSLIAYGKWLRGIVYALLHTHSLTLDNYAPGMGYGTDFYSAMQYYAIGDPLHLPAAFLPSRCIYYYFQLLIVLRPYLAGLSFSLLCRGRLRCGAPYESRPCSETALLAGSLSYAFCGTVLFIGMWNLFFVNPMILLPLLILGADRILAGKSPVLFILAVCYAVVSNFYFCYMLALMTIGYIAVCLLLRGKHAAEADARPEAKASPTQITAEPKATRRDQRAASVPRLAGRLFACGLLGVCMGAVILLPVVLAFLQNPRAGLGSHGVSLLYPPSYYRELFKNLIAYVYKPDGDTELGFTFLAVPVICLLLLRRRAYRKECLLLGLQTLFLLLPVGGYVMAGFSYMVNRWCFSIELTIALLITALWDDLTVSESARRAFSRRQSRLLLLAAALYILVCFALGHTKDPLVVAQLALLAVCAALFFARPRFKTGPAVFVLLLAGILANGYFANAPSQGDFPKSFLERMSGDEFLERLDSTEARALKETVGDGLDDMYRYSGRNLVWNAPLLDGISSTQYYWSLANGAIADFMKEMALDEESDFTYYGLDDRTALLHLVCADYYTLRFDTEEERRYVPAGFSRFAEYYNFAIYHMDAPLSPGYLYTHAIPGAAYDAMTPVMRQEALLQGIVADGAEAALPAAGPSFTHKTLPFTITAEENVILQDDNTFVVTDEDGGSCLLIFNAPPACETYLYFRGLRTKNTSEMENIRLTALRDGEELVKKRLYYRTPESQYYSGWHDFLVNFGSAEAPDAVRVYFPGSGIYSLDELQVISQPVAPLLAHAEALSGRVMTDVRAHRNPVSKTTHEITGRIDCDTEGWLLLTIPWDAGWSATVDGAPAALVRANTMFCALPLREGAHEIALTYKTPGLTAGIAVSLLAWLLFFLRLRRLFGLRPRI